MTTPNIDFSQLQTLLPLHIKTNQVPFLAGDPGIGKSATVKKLADDFDTKVFVLSINGISTKEDLTGARMVEDKSAKYGAKQVFFPTAVVSDAVSYANEHSDKPVILFLDEINRTTPDVTSAFMSIITERKIGDVELPDNIRLIAAGNDRGNVTQLDQASISRMQVYHVQPDINPFFKAVPDLNFYIKQVLQKNPKLLVQTNTEEIIPDGNDEDGDGDDEEKQNTNFFDDLENGSQMKQIAVPRTLKYLSDSLNQIGLNGKSVPANIDDYYDPLDIENSALNQLVIATIGDNDTSNQLLQTITNSIESLQALPATPNPQIVSYPKPDQKLLNEIQNNVKTIDELNTVMKTANLDALSNTLYSLMSIDGFNKLPSSTLFETYYTNLSSQLDENHTKEIIKNAASMIINNEVAKPVLKFIPNQSDPLSVQLSAIVKMVN